MRTIIFDYHPFAMNSKAYVIKDSKTSYDISSDLNIAALKLMAMAYNNNIYEIKVQGHTEAVNKLKELINEKEMSAYSMTKINVEAL